ncbi:transposase [Streptomyces lavendulocolor]
MAVHLAAVSATMKVIIDRALYLPADWAADEERREVAGVPEETGFATKPQQALSMVTDALATGIEARWFADDEVYCNRELRRGIRSLGIGYTVGIAAAYPVTDGSGRKWEARKLINKVRPRQWLRRQTDTAPRAPASTTGPGSTSAPTRTRTRTGRERGRVGWSRGGTSSSVSYGPSHHPHPPATVTTSCTGPPSDAITKPSRPPTNNDTANTTNRDHELQVP